MRLLIVAAAAISAFGSAARGADFSEFRSNLNKEISAIEEPSPREMTEEPSAPSIPEQKVLCAIKPVLGRATLPDPLNYIRKSKMVFEVDGVRVHVAGNKAQNMKYGYYLAFAAEGDDEVVWANPGLGKKQFQFKNSLKNKTFTVEGHGILWNDVTGHDERITITVTQADGGPVTFKKADGTEGKSFTSGELARAVQESGPLLELSAAIPGELAGKVPSPGKRTYRLTLSQNIVDAKGQAQWDPGKYTLLVTTYDEYKYDGNKIGYNFKKYYFDANSLKGKTIFPKSIGSFGPSKHQQFNLTYGFHITSEDRLEVYDLTEYGTSPQDRGLPYCLPAK